MVRIIIDDLLCSWKPLEESFAGKLGGKTNLTIFRLHFANLLADIEYLQSILETEEQVRANRYYLAKDRNRFVICRGVLKLLLSRFTGLRPKAVVLQKSDFQKPFLSSGFEIKFNVSHTDTYGLIAIGETELGIDLEFMDENYGFETILPRVFNKADLKRIDNDANPLRKLFTYWTRKEAFVKAIGKGIDDSIIEIPVHNGNHSINKYLLHGLEGNMNVYTFNVSESHIGSIAFSNKRNRVKKIAAFSIESACNV